MSSEQSRPRAVFWDMDGTLVDTEPLWGVATYEMSELLGRRLTPELREQTVGGPFVDTLKICAEHAGVDADYDQWRRWMYDRMAELMHGNVLPGPGVTELLAELDMPMLVTTNTERELADPCIDAIGRDFFSGSLTGDEVPNPKPAPDMYLAAAERVGQRPQDCLVFEDSWNGMTAAAHAGCRVIGLAHEVPAGVVSMVDLQGEIGFEGVTAQTVGQWWTTLNDREEL